MNDGPVTCRPYAVVEEGINAFHSHNDGSAIPRALLRSRLAEAVQPSELRSNNRLQGNRTCAAALPDACRVLLGHASGPARDSPTVSVLRTADDIHAWQVISLPFCLLSRPLM